MFPFDQDVLGLLVVPYFACAVEKSPEAVHPSNVYPSHVGFAIAVDLIFELYVAVISAYVVVFNVQLLFLLNI